MYLLTDCWLESGFLEFALVGICLTVTLVMRWRRRMRTRTRFVGSEQAFSGYACPPIPRRRLCCLLWHGGLGRPRFSLAASTVFASTDSCWEVAACRVFARWFAGSRLCATALPCACCGSPAHRFSFVRHGSPVCVLRFPCSQDLVCVPRLPRVRAAVPLCVPQVLVVCRGSPVRVLRFPCVPRLPRGHALWRL